jgi:hypothetical protein
VEEEPLQEPLSWWCQKSREELAREIAVRMEGWKRQRVGLLDLVGEKLRESWEPARAPRER